MLDGVGLSVGKTTVVGNALVATGTGRVLPFSIIAPPGVHKVIYNQVGATALNGNIEVSSDGGTTWRILQAFDLITNPTISHEVYHGVQYRFNVTTLTTTPANIYATLN